MKAGCTNEGILGRKRSLGNGCVTLSRTLLVNQSRPESIEIRIHFYAFRSNEDFSVLIEHRIVRIKLYHKDEVFSLKMCWFLCVCGSVCGGADLTNPFKFLQVEEFRCPKRSKT